MPSSLQPPTTVAVRDAVVPHDVCSRHPEEPADLLGHLLEDATRRHSARDERGDSAQRRLLVRERALGRLARRERFARPRALGGHGREHQRGERRDGDEQLRRQQAVGDRVAQERPVVLRRVPDRDRADDEDGRGGSARSEADRRPQQDREDDVGHIALRGQLRQRDEHDQHDETLHELAPVQAPQTGGRPGQDQRGDDEHAAGVAQSPGPKHLPELVSRDHVAQLQRQRAERGTDHRRDQRADEECEHVGDPVEPTAATRQPAQEQSRDHERHGVPDRLREHRPQRGGEVAECQITDHDRRPQAHAIEEQHGEAETGRRPQGGHRAIQVGQLEADAAGDVVRQRHDRHTEHIERQPPVLPAAQGIDPRPHRIATGVNSAGQPCPHGLTDESALSEQPVTASQHDPGRITKIPHST